MIPITEVLDKVRNEVGSKITIRGVSINKTQTLKLFAKKGVQCVSCNRTPAYFMYFESEDNGFLKLMLYHNQRNGLPNFMTKDHIVPQSHGGPNMMYNYQPMCADCNCKKGPKFNMKNVPIDVVPHLSKRQQLRWYTETRLTVQSTPELVDLHKQFIVQRTITRHSHAKFGKWSNQIREQLVSDAIKSFPDLFHVKSFNRAFHQLTTDVVTQTGTNKTKTPAVIFEQLGYKNNC